jgi:hypothetical protein
MTSERNYILNLRNGTLAVCFVFLALTSAQAQTPDANKIWTTVGSGGTLDETSVGRVFFDHGVVQMGRPVVGQTSARGRAGVLQQTQSAVIRYNVTPVDGLFTLRPQSCTGGCSAYKLTLRYLAAGSNARVVANLIEVDLATGAETTRLSFNSNNFPKANRYQVKDGEFSCGPTFSFDFKRKAYYIEATLTASSIVVAGSAAGIQIIKIEIDSCQG